MFNYYVSKFVQWYRPAVGFDTVHCQCKEFQYQSYKLYQFSLDCTNKNTDFIVVAKEASY
jgi:hypothetical protein